MLLKACLNGPRGRETHPALPVSPAELARAAAAAVHAGADALHVHPKDVDGVDTLDPGAVAEALTAIRAAVPGVPVGVTTGAWTAPEPAQRVEAVRAWTVQPDFASVNWHEDGAEAVADQLLERGIGVEAGLWQAESVAAWLAWPGRERCVRILLEVVHDLAEDAAVAHARTLVGRLGEGPSTDLPVLLHGEKRAAWPVLREALRLGLDVRIGLEDTLVRPDGRWAADNAELVADAVALARHRRPS